MAAAALPMVAQAANDDPTIKGIKQAAADEARAFAKDPIGETCDLLIKAGTIFAIAGGFLYAIAKATAGPEQAYLNDIQDRLGLPRQSSPTGVAPAVPPTPFYQTDLNTITSCVNSLSPSSAPTNQVLLGTASQAADDLVKQAQTGGAPTQVLNDVTALATAIHEIASATNFIVDAVAAGSPQSIINDLWTSAHVYAATVPTLANAVATDYGLTQPYPAAASPTPSVPWWDVPLAVASSVVGAVEADVGAVTSAAANAAQTILSDAEAVGSDVGTGLAYLGKMIQSAPVLLWDSLGYGITWGVNTVASDLWLLLLTLGLAMVLVGCLVKFFYKKFWPRLERRIELNANARVARLWARFDSWNATRAKVGQVRKQAKVEESVAEANALAVPPEPVSVPATVEPAQTLHETPPLNAPIPAPEPEKPLPLGTPTTEVESQLGEPKAIEPSADDLRAQEAARVASLPPPPPPAPAQPQQAPPPVEVTIINPPPRPRRKRRDSREPSSAQLMALASA
jgi:hypothetical protein